MKMNIPYLSTPDKPLSSTTQKFMPIADITDNLVLFKSGAVSVVLESTSLNFGLLSLGEQEAAVSAFAALLNSLSFPVQITVRSQRKDITSYMEYLEQASLTNIAHNPKLAIIAQDYKAFILDAVKKKNVLSKKFYITIPFSQLELGIAKSFASVTKRGETLPFTKDYVVQKAKVALYPKRDHIIRQAGRLGITLKQLQTKDLITLCYRYFNPAPPATLEDRQKLQEQLAAEEQ